MSFPFFLSYAHNDNRPDLQQPGVPDPYLEEFWRELSRRVRQLTGSAQDGFRDRPELKPGEEWAPALVDALSTSPVLVCLYSPSYFQSPACGRELQVFLERRTRYVRKNAGKRPANIIPILWHPCRIPKTVPDFQFQGPRKLDPQEGGVWAERDQGRGREFRQVIQEVAIRVRDASDATPLPPPSYVPVFGAVPNAFLPPPLPLEEFDTLGAPCGPQCVTFVYAGVPSWESWPYAPPAEHALLYVSSSIAKGREFEPRQLAFDTTSRELIPRLDEARRKNNIVVCFVNGATIANETIRARLTEYDGRGYKNFSTMVIWPPGGRTAALEQLLRQTLPDVSSRHPPYFYPSIETGDQLDRALADTLDVLKMAVLRDPQNAQSLPGVSVFSTLPFLRGPGEALAV
jgi:hypothetical protein